MTRRVLVVRLDGAGDVLLAGRKPIRWRGVSASRTWWLCGPVPCRLTATSGGGPHQRSRSGSLVGSRVSTAPVRTTSGASEPAVARTVR